MWLSQSAMRMCATATLVVAAGMAAAQDYPNRPIRVIAGSVGGGTDLESRLIAQNISGPLGQSVIVENRAGVAAFEFVANAAPDGYTLLTASIPFYVAPLLLRKATYDPVTDFSPITLITRAPNILVVHPSLPVKSVRDLIALAKAKPGALNYGSGPIGNSTHLAAEMFKAMAAVRLERVSYKGGGQAIIDLLSGHIQLSFATPASVASHIKSGKLRALGVTSAKVSALLPDVPTIAASGLPGFEFVGMDAVFAPARTPAAIVSRLNQEIVRYLRTPDAKARFLAVGVEAAPSTPAELSTMLKADITKIGSMIKDAGITGD